MFIIAPFIILIFVIIAYNSPKLAILLVLVFGFLPQLFMFTNLYDSVNNVLAVGGGFIAVDLILVGMAGAVIIKLINSNIYIKVQKTRINILPFLISLFSILLFFEIIRNIPKYGISAPGEFRFRYLVLIIPVYISLFLTKKKDINKVLKTVLYFSVILPVIFIPFVIFNHNYQGEVYRLFGSNISLGFLFAFIIVFMLGNVKEVKLGKYFYLFLIPIGLILITDTHRSVWISGVVTLLLLIKFKYLKLNKMIGFAALVLVLFYFSLSLIKDTGIKNPVEYLSKRANIYTTTENEQGTGYWRLMVWQTNILDTYNNHFLLGRGFGGYWDLYVPELKSIIKASPHSLYVQNFAMLGLIGLLLYLFILYIVYKRFNIKLKYLKKITNYNFYTKMILFGVTVLVAQHIYYFMYSFSYLPLIYLGLTYSFLKIGNNKKDDLYNNSRP